VSNPVLSPKRSVLVPKPSSMLSQRLRGIACGTTDGDEFNAIIGTGYDAHIGRFTVGPLASLQ
jgi:hypothetical protein